MRDTKDVLHASKGDEVFRGCSRGGVFRGGVQRERCSGVLKGIGVQRRCSRGGVFSGMGVHVVFKGRGVQEYVQWERCSWGVQGEKCSGGVQWERCWAHRQRVSTIFLTEKLTFCSSCASDGVRTSRLRILIPMLYPMSHPPPLL